MTDVHKDRYKELRKTLDNAEDCYLSMLEVYREAEERLGIARQDFDNVRRQIFAFIDIISDLPE